MVPQDWFKIICNPSFPYRLSHVAIATFIVVALIMAATGAWHLLKGRRDPAQKTVYSMALWLLLVLAPIQILVDDQHGLNTRKYQPAKIAAIEGLWKTEHGGTALNLVGLEALNLAIPAMRKDQAAEMRNVYGIARFVLLRGPTGLIALLAGWVTTEMGRQPWVVYGVMRTVDAVSPISAQAVSLALMAFIVVYCVVFGTGIYYILWRLAQGPSPSPVQPSAIREFDACHSGRRPMSAVE